MKLPNDLLKAMAIGLALTGTIASCDLIDMDGLNPGEVTCEEPAEERQINENNGHIDNCPLCGLG